MQPWIPSCQCWDGKRKRKGKVFSASLLPARFGFCHSSSSKGIGGMAQELQRTPGAASQRICVQLPKDPKISPKVCQHISQKDPRKPPKGSMCIPPKSQNITKSIYPSLRESQNFSPKDLSSRGESGAWISPRIRQISSFQHRWDPSFPLDLGSWLEAASCTLGRGW